MPARSSLSTSWCTVGTAEPVKRERSERDALPLPEEERGEYPGLGLGPEEGEQGRGLCFH